MSKAGRFFYLYAFIYRKNEKYIFREPLPMEKSLCERRCHSCREEAIGVHWLPSFRRGNMRVDEECLSRVAAQTLDDRKSVFLRVITFAVMLISAFLRKGKEENNKRREKVKREQERRKRVRYIRANNIDCQSDSKDQRSDNSKGRSLPKTTNKQTMKPSLWQNTLLLPTYQHKGSTNLNRKTQKKPQRIDLVENRQAMFLSFLSVFFF